VCGANIGIVDHNFIAVSAPNMNGKGIDACSFDDVPFVVEDFDVA
jgi:hypothetical protein